MPRVVGLDVGSFGVRAAEMNVGGGPPTLLRFAQVALPANAVRGGEIADAEAVAAAIKRLWREGGFKAKAAIVGVANQRVIIRQAELPAMSESDLATALQFEAQELIPIPVEDALLDFQILEQIQGDAEPRMRILLAAAQREMVQTHLSALTRAGIGVALVDVVPFALVRAVAGSATPLDSGVEAIVCIGGGVTNVVIHEQGVPRFVRILMTGGDVVTEAISRSLNVDLDVAEDLKRRSWAPNDDASSQAAQVVATQISSIVEEIRGSLEYYVSQPDALPLQRVLVTGGGSRTPGLVERLQQQLFAPVEVAHPLAGIKVGDVGLSDQQLAEAEPLLTVPIGLALAGTPLPKGARRINLVPREVRVKAQARQQGILVAAGIGALAVVLGGLAYVHTQQVQRENDRADEAEQRVATLQARVNSLQDVARLDSEIASKLATIETILASDVQFPRLITEIATIMPADVWLTAMTASAVAPVVPGGNVGSVNVSVIGFDHTSTARWILRLNTLPSITEMWVPASSKSGPGQATVSFSATALLTPASVSRRIDSFRSSQ